MGALGGGTFTSHNKILPGAYHNVVSARSVDKPFGNRGNAALALPLDWGEAGKVIIIEKEKLQTNSLNLLGYPYPSSYLKPIRDVLIGAKVLYLYNLNTNSKKAQASVGDLKMEAKYGGVAGNNISVKVQPDINRENYYNVSIRMHDTEVYKKSVINTEELINDFVSFEGTLNETSITVLTPLVGGENGEATVADHSDFLDAIEEFHINAVGLASDDNSLKVLYSAYANRMRDESGIKIQVVIYEPDINKFNFEGVIEVHNKTLDDAEKPYEAIYHTLGIEAGCAENTSTTNMTYSGAYEIEGVVSGREAERLLEQGKFVYYKKKGEIRVLEDINSLIKFTAQKGEDFSKNQVIRVIDRRSNDISAIFNGKYLGKVTNNEDGRISLWSDIVKSAEELQKTGAIEDYNSEETIVGKGEKKDDVVPAEGIKAALAMQKLYMTSHVY